jgi:hypothetical protein
MQENQTPAANEAAPKFLLIDKMSLNEIDYLKMQVDNLREIQFFALQQLDLISANLNRDENQ